MKFMKKSECVKFILCFSDKISFPEINWLISCRKFDNLQHKQRSSLTEDFLTTAVCTMCVYVQLYMQIWCVSKIEFLLN